MEFLKHHSARLVGLMLVALFVLSTFVSWHESAIYDEKAHIPAAYTYINAGDMRLNPEHPPLIKDLVGLPLQFLPVNFPYASNEWQNGTNEQWSTGDLFINCSDPAQVCNDGDAILFWSRIPITLVAVLLGIVLFLWTRELGGTLAGLLAVAFYAFDPNIIAHSHYVTTDIGIAAFIFFAFYFFIRFLKNPKAKNVFVAGIFLGLAELTKFSAVLLFPVFGLFAFVYALTKLRPESETLSSHAYRLRTIIEYALKYSGSILVCFILIWIVYFFNTLHMPGEKLVAMADQMLSQNNAPAQFAHAFVVNTSKVEMLKPFSEYFLGVAKVFARVAGGNDYYFLGHISTVASPWYFPVIFILKETLIFLFALLLISIYALCHVIKSFSHNTDSFWNFFAQSFQNKIAQYLSVFFVLFYSAVSITGNLNIGFRHLFPILPFLYMLVGKSVFDFYKRHSEPPITRTVLHVLLGCMVLVIIAVPILAYPGYLSYFNAAAGGRSNGYAYATDSNYDWGQDMKYLKAFVDAHNRCVSGASVVDDCRITNAYPSIDKIRVDYFGGSSPSYYLKDKYVAWWDKRTPESGWYAISVEFIQSSLYGPRQPGERSYTWLNNIQPITRAGDSIFIYYIP